MRKFGYLGILVAVVAGLYFMVGSKKDQVPDSYGQAMSEGKSYFYAVKWEYTVEQKLPVQFETVTGLPEPPPGFVVIKERRYAEGTYKWSGKPVKAFYNEITKQVDSLGVFYRKIDLKQL